MSTTAPSDRAVALGRLTVQRVPEMERWAIPVQRMFPGLSPEALADAKARYDARFIDPSNDDIILAVHTWVVRTPTRTILIDTCNGNHKERVFLPEVGNLDTPYLDRLVAAGVRPEEVDLVMCTHLHPDHVGWNTRLVDGRWVPTFPNAKYLMSEIDHRTFSKVYAGTPEGPAIDLAAAYGDSVLPVVEAGQAVLIKDGHRIEEELDAGVWLEGAPGHTKGHVVVHLESDGHRALATGDAIHHVLQLNDLDLPALGDRDEPLAAATRRRLIEGLVDTDTLLLPGHFPAPSFGRVVSDGDRLEFAFEHGD